MENYTIPRNLLAPGDILMLRYKVVSIIPNRNTVIVQDVYTGKRKTLTNVPSKITITRNES